MPGERGANPSLVEADVVVVEVEVEAVPDVRLAVGGLTGDIGRLARGRR